MADSSNSHNRQSIRLHGFAYTQLGAYFVTLVTYQRECIFGEMAGEHMVLSPLGRIAEQQWLRLPSRFPHWKIDEFVIMPNHTHGVLIKRSFPCAASMHRPGTSNGSLPGAASIDSPGILDGSLRPYVAADSLGAVIRSYKSAVAFRYHQSKASPEEPLWQRNYYEHIIRDDEDLDRIRLYILENPLRWADDEENIRRL